MTLNSVFFLPFMLLVIAVMFFLQYAGKHGWKMYASAQKLFLLVVSYLFIGLSNYMYAVILFITSVFVYCMGIRLEKCRNRILISFSVTMLILELAVFKYTDFFLSTLADCFRQDYILPKIILPVGISFYVFTSIGYLVDVYRNKYGAEKNFINVGLMISLFTKVISGPIVRGETFLPQLNTYKGISSEGLLNGTQIFFVGLFKKIVLADHLSVFVDDVFAAPTAFNSFSVILAVISYSLQIYFDFSGYSDMAIGASQMIGLRIPANFNLPYVAKTPSEFWNRWHISLSSFLKDYLYISLGGNRKGTVRTYFNLFIVMLISGLWHGAGWTFIVWGALHGIYSCVFRFLDNISGKKLSKAKHVTGAVMSLLNFIIVSIFWVFFRADSFSDAFLILKQCISAQGGINQPYAWTFFAIAVLLLSTTAAAVKSKKHGDSKISAVCMYRDLSKVQNQVLFFTFVGITIIMGYFGNTQFIYGAF